MSHAASSSRPALDLALLVATVAALCLIAHPDRAHAKTANGVASAANIPYSGISPGDVDMATGKIIIVCRPDLYLDGPMPLVFERYYGSMLAP